MLKKLVSLMSLPPFTWRIGNHKDTKIKHLINRLKNAKGDKEKVGILYTLVWEYEETNPYTSILLNNRAMNLSKKLRVSNN